MSASLVGSEMCIRDRGMAVGAPRTRRAGTGSSRRQQNLRWARPGLPHYPVSYTHLTLPTICSV
eukprot:3726038-Alexandrium_andersonii.AAC.1